MRQRPTKVLAGWVELVDLPDWGVTGLRAKLDTGARSSALHVEDLEELPDARVRFRVVSDRAGCERDQVECEVHRRGKVRSSGGVAVERIFVRARVCLGGIEREVELSLVDRGPMVYRMLLGRKALARALVVDPGRRYLLSATGNLFIRRVRRRVVRRSGLEFAPKGTLP